MLSRLSRAGWIGLCLPLLCSGALRWETQSIELTAGLADRELMALFRFTNTGDQPVTITTLKPDCGCTTAVLDKRTYAPGEFGEIRAGFSIGERVGVHHKHIVVATAEEPGSPAVLQLTITIPESLVCTPRTLFWKRHDPSEEKVIEIRPSGGRRLASLEVTGANSAAFARRMEPAGDEVGFRLLLRPLSTQNVAQGTLFCVAKFSDGTTRSFTVSALVH